jgi:Bacterial membrane protein YfhO
MIDDEKRVSVPVAPPGSPTLETARWRFVGKIDDSNSGYGPEVKPADIGWSHVYENLRARPRAWLVPQVVQVTEEEALNAVRTSRLSDGRTIDLSTVAVVEEALPTEVTLWAGSPNYNGSARVKLLTDSVMEVETNSSTNAFLLTSDTNYPGWKATVDGQAVNIYQADYLIRGVVVPAGSHLVRFEFRPSTLYVGSAVSIASLLLLIGLCFRRPSALNEQS